MGGSGSKNEYPRGFQVWQTWMWIPFPLLAGSVDSGKSLDLSPQLIPLKSGDVTIRDSTLRGLPRGLNPALGPAWAQCLARGKRRVPVTHNSFAFWSSCSVMERLGCSQNWLALLHVAKQVGEKCWASGDAALLVQLPRTVRDSWNLPHWVSAVHVKICLLGLSRVWCPHGWQDTPELSVLTESQPWLFTRTVCPTLESLSFAQE